MSQGRAAMVGWTGRGRPSDLTASVRAKLAEDGCSGRVELMGNTLVVSGAEPAGVAASIGHLPGVEWVAAGMRFASLGELGRKGEELARRYLRKRERFHVLAEGRGDVVASDLVGALTARVLGSVEGLRVDERSPTVTFRVSFDGKEGAVGVQLAQGPGGFSTGQEGVVCLVSGGKHSSVLAWMALLAGLRVRLVHGKVDEESLAAVAGLYSELSHRAGPGAASLDVVLGGSPGRGVLELIRQGGEVMAGFTRGAHRPDELRGLATSPLFLLPEEEFDRRFEELGLRQGGGTIDWEGNGGTNEVRSYGGKSADISEVLDALGGRRPRRS